MEEIRRRQKLSVRVHFSLSDEAPSSVVSLSEKAIAIAFSMKNCAISLVEINTLHGNILSVFN